MTKIALRYAVARHASILGSLIFASATAGQAQASAVAAQAYCQAITSAYSGDSNSDNPGVVDITQGSSSCIALASYTSTIRGADGSFTPYSSSSSVSADLSTGSLKLGTEGYVGSSPDSSVSAYGSLSDTLYITGATNGRATLSLLFDGIVGPGGEFNTRLIVEGGNTVADDNITYLDAAYHGSAYSSYISLSEGSVYDARAGRVDVPIDFFEGSNQFLVYLIGDTTGNAAFAHTIGLQLLLPQGASYSSDSGVFLTSAQDNITGGVTFAPGVIGAVPEPATWALMIGGFGLVGGSMRVRSRKVSFAPA